MLSMEAKIKLKKMLIKHEGYSKFVYIDTLGNKTVGIGYNIGDRGLSDEWIMQQYDADVAFFYNQLDKDYSWFKQLSPVRQAVLVDMCFMGYRHLVQFYKMFNALEHQNYKLAAAEMLDSLWAKQVGSRATDLARMMELDQWMD